MLKVLTGLCKILSSTRLGGGPCWGVLRGTRDVPHIGELIAMLSSWAVDGLSLGDSEGEQGGDR